MAQGKRSITAIQAALRIFTYELTVHPLTNQCNTTVMPYTGLVSDKYSARVPVSCGGLPLAAPVLPQ